MKHCLLRIVTSAFTGHRGSQRFSVAKKGQCQFNFLKVSTKKTSETIFQHDSYGTLWK